MPSICLYFQVHQPYRLKSYDCFKIGYDHAYDDEEMNKRIIDRVCDQCYLPANAILMELIKKYNGKFNVSFSISGTALDQLEKYRTDTLISFQELADTNCVEFISETYYHSLSFLYSKEEFVRQVGMHRQQIELLFRQSPTIFRNTELLYNNEIARFVNELGYRGILCEGLDNVLYYNSPNRMYHAPHNENFKCLLRNYRLSDDIAFRFQDKHWREFPLTSKKFANWLHQVNGCSEVINIFMDYETFGEHLRADTGILNFLKKFPGDVLRNQSFNFITLSEALQTYPSSCEYNVKDLSSWADTERDVSAWLGNDLQLDASERIYGLEQRIKETGDQHLLDNWAKLLTSDHFYYMSTKHFQDGDVHTYFSPYKTPYDAYINFMNVVTDLEYILENKEYNKPTESNDDTQPPALDPSIYM